MVKTYGEVYLRIKKALREAGIEAAELEGREIVAAAAGKTVEDFLRDRTMYASEAVEEKAEDMLRRRLEGEPIGYVLGQWEFMGLTFKLTRDVLIPRTDTETLASRALDLARSEGAKRLLDVCCGCGCIGISVAKYVAGLQVWMTDISDAALAVARFNARELNVLARVNCMRLDALKTPPRLLKDFDIICCNPPYIMSGTIPQLDASVRDYEPHLALDGGQDGLDFYRAIAPGYFGALRPGGHILFEVGIGQANDVAEIMTGCGYSVTEILKDSANIDRVVVGTRNKEDKR